jgi:hypothetical protein
LQLGRDFWRKFVFFVQIKVFDSERHLQK